MEENKHASFFFNGVRIGGIEQIKARNYEKRTAALERLTTHQMERRGTNTTGPAPTQPTLKQLALPSKKQAKDAMGTDFSNAKMVTLFQLCLDESSGSDTDQ